MIPSVGIKAILEAAGVHASDTWPIKIGRKPPTPDQVIVLYDSGGRDPMVKSSVDFPNIQVIVRGSKGASGYSDAYNKVVAIQTALLGIPSGPSQYSALTSCVQRGGISPLGYDDNDRPMFSINFQLIVEPTPTGYRCSL